MAKMTRKQIVEASKKGAELAAKSGAPARQKHIKRLSELKQKAHKR